MIRRTLQPILRSLACEYPVLTLTGPRQSAKTTLARSAFPQYSYVNLEDPDQREFATQDPRGFLGQFPGKVILDEVQRTPDLFSFVQAAVDRDNPRGKFILTGSQNFLLMRKISQSLAGRAAISHVLPFSMAELEGRQPLSLSQIGRQLPRQTDSTRTDLMEVMFGGFYPPIHDRGHAPGQWLANYYQTYVERDVREVLNVGDIEAFGRFIRLCAGRNGQLLNLSSLANDCGITHTTARRWISVLEASFLIILLRPHHKNFSKRMIKSPKLYFLDTGFLCYLLRIRSPEDLRIHSSRGAVFESLVISELLKNYFHQGKESDLYFWRDSGGHEVDVLIDSGKELLPIEIKSGETIASDFFGGLHYWLGLTGEEKAPAALIYGGDSSMRRSGVAVYPWSCL